MSPIVIRWRTLLAIRQQLLAVARRKLAYWERQKAKAKPGTDRMARCSHMLADRRKLVARREQQVAAAKRVIRRHTPLPMRERAYREAIRLVGVMEQGGNNVGPQVSALIEEGGGIPGQAWCGWFQAVCYKRAGSKAVTWQWGAVRLYLPLPGISRTSTPRRGDLVRFTFDHIGMFVADNGDGTIETIEGNTGPVGAVSDSKTGGDGVYRKTRSKALVRDYLHVSR